jgi:hypothetical protein
MQGAIAVALLVLAIAFVGYYLVLAFMKVPDSYWEKTGRDPKLHPELTRGFSARRAARGGASVATDPRVLMRVVLRLLRLH